MQYCHLQDRIFIGLDGLHPLCSPDFTDKYPLGIPPGDGRRIPRNFRHVSQPLSAKAHAGIWHGTPALGNVRRLK